MRIAKISLQIALTLNFSAVALANAETPNYAEALQKSIYFYEAQQSGVLPEWNRTEWRGDSTVNDGSDNNIDLSGGWYDAGDHVKFGFPMAASATMLAWGVVEYPQAYEQSGQMQHIKNNLRFVADYFVSAHPSTNVLYGQVGSGADDHSWWGPVEVIESTTRAASNRPSYAVSATCPGSDLAGETSAALAAIAMVFADDEPTYSAKLLAHSRQLYTFAKTYLGKYSDCITDATAFYNSWSGYHDELVWSAIWLHKATGEASYLDAAKADYADLSVENQTTIKSYKWTHAWDDKAYGSYVLLAQLTGDPTYRADAERWLDFWSTGYNGERVSYTAGGLAQLSSWGATRYAANTSFIALLYSDYLNQADPTNSRVQAYKDFAIGQMEYIMGDNPKGIPYQIGMAANGPKNPHHRTAHGSWSDSSAVPVQSRHLLVGALVGGPGSGDAYEDDRDDYIANEVATDYNAGFTSALARMYLEFGGTPIPEADFPAKEEKDLEFYVEAKVNSTGPRYIEIGSLTHNHSAWPAKVSDNLTLRYWVDLTAEMEKGYSASDISVTAAYSQASSVSQLQSWGDAADNIYYTDVSFAGVEIFPGGQSASRKEVQFRISLPSSSNLSEWDNSEDPSWANYSNAYAPAPQIALYDGDTLVWGSEPTAGCGDSTGINCIPTAENSNVSTAFETPVTVNLSAADSDGSISGYTVTQPSFGQLSGSGDTRTYTPNDNFSGNDSFTYTATDNDGAVSAPATVNVSVAEAIIPSVAITSPTSGSEVFTGQDITVQYSFTNAASVNIMLDGAIVVAATTATSATVAAPEVTGAFVIEVVSLDSDGNSLDANQSVNLVAIEQPENSAPDAQFTVDTSGLSVVLDASQSSDIDGDSLTYIWDFGDESGVSENGVIANHTYDVAGTYTVSLTVDDGQGHTDVTTQNVTVTEPVVGNSSCEYIVSNEWNAGFVAVIRITNNGSTPINGWEVSWGYDDGTARTQGWNANVTGNNPYTATSLSWNNTIPVGGSVEFGMQGTKGVNDSPAVVPTVTGDVCN
ncbi:glycoside hydrolase family 9 protein [Colwellia echini]|uniref:Endoglucanase n=1 Tax=Colwellia echini TaxID=1982103 RepID=A0ABY3MVC4_9GAMM|nr:glycoside hydrolase family 9 protein [Colwellia echini]TYK65145.1 PKD domain-containing protein [Colwellia echini]